MGRKTCIPAWILKYRERIERGEISIEQILEEENRIREKPIKLATVKRAINALGFSVEELRRRGLVRSASAVTTDEVEEDRAVSEGRQEEEPSAEGMAERAETVETVETAEMAETAERADIEAAEGGEEGVKKRKRKEKAPTWILKYKDKIERGEITPEQILEEENKRREKPIKLATVKRAINSLGFSVGALRTKEEEKRAPEEEGRARVAVERKAEGYRIDNLSESTERRFKEVKRRWERCLGKSISNDHFMNILLALASLIERGKTLIPRKM